MSRKTVDDLLRGWAARHAPSEAQGRDLAARIGDGLSQGQTLTPKEDATGRRPWRVPARLAWAVGGAAALLVAAAAFLLIRSGRPGSPEPTQLGRVSEAEMEGSRRLFRELDTLFGGELRAVVESEAGVHLNLAPAAGGPASDAVPLLVRVTVAVRKPGEAEWQKAFEADILTRTEELVEAVPDPGRGNRIVLWACSLPDGKMAVEASLRLADLDGCRPSTPLVASADVTAVLTPGKPKQILAVKTAEGEYRVFLIAVPLPGRRSAPCSST